MPSALTLYRAARALERYNPLQKRDHHGRWSDGMPDVIAEFPVRSLTGSLTVRATRHGEGSPGGRDVELDDGTHSVVLNAAEQGRITNAMRSEYTAEDVVVRRDGKVIARVRAGGRTENEDGESITAGKRLDIGEVDDPADYDSRPGIAFSNKLAGEPFETGVGLGASAGRAETGYGPLDSFANDKRQMTLRMKDDDGNPTEVTFSAVEWRRIKAAYNLVWEGFDEDNPDEDAPDIDTVRVKTKAGPVDVSWSGSRGGYGDESTKLKIQPADPAAAWGVIIDGPHLEEVTDVWEWAGIASGIHESVAPSALDLWRALEAWDAALHPRGPGGRFIKGGGGHIGGHSSRRPSLGDAVLGTAAAGPKRQRADKGGMSVADAVRASARRSDSTGRPTQRSPAEHRAEGAHDVADEVERALADHGVPESQRKAIAARARAAADAHGQRPSTKLADQDTRDLEQWLHHFGTEHRRSGAVQRELDRRKELTNTPTYDLEGWLHEFGTDRPRSGAIMAELDRRRARDGSPAAPSAARPAALPSAAPAPSPRPRREGLGGLLDALDGIPSARERSTGGREPLVDTVRRAQDDVDAGRITPHEAADRLDKLSVRYSAVPGPTNDAINSAIGDAATHLRSVAPPARAKRSPAKRTSPRMDADHLVDIESQLSSATSTRQAREHLSGLTVSQLRQVASFAQVSVGSGDTKERILDRIVDATAGRRLDAAAIDRMARR